ncbi:MAG: hypothetical protein DRJ13_18320 [Bacteroidetes bacterium]|nr:MAG: hypothetical protein DRJ13_18320 [Bacteroidota bacterium]
MSNHFLARIHDHITNQIENTLCEKARIDALCVIERFLNMNIKPKLPKRFRQNFPGINLACSVNESSPSDRPSDDI